MILSAVSFISSKYFYENHTNHYPNLSHTVAGVASLINPSDQVGASWEEPSNFYINEDRSILLLFVLSVVFGFIGASLIYRARRGTNNQPMVSMIVLGFASSCSALYYLSTIRLML